MDSYGLVTTRKITMANSSCKDDDGYHAHIPEHLLFQIFLRLPVKSLLRFKSVCKSWFSFIESSDFVNQHCRHRQDTSKDDHIVIYGCDHRLTSSLVPLRPLKFSVLLDRDDFFVDLDLSLPGLTSCAWSNQFNMLSFDGIICLYDHTTHPRTGELMRGMYIHLWNPATRKIRFLPRPPWTLPFRSKHYTVGLGLGLGFDGKTNDYKVVRITILRSRMDGLESRVEVYSLSTHSWRTLNVELPVDEIGSSIKEPLRNGRIYCWCARKVGGTNHLLLWFDFSNDEFGTIPFPDSIRHCPQELTIIRDNIACINYTENDRFEVWIMNDFGVKESWTNLYRSKFRWTRLVSILNDRKSDGKSLLVLSHGDLCFYDIAIRKTEEFPLEKKLAGRVIVKDVRYKESLVSIERRNDAANSLTTIGHKHKRHKPLHWPSDGIY